MIKKGYILPDEIIESKELNSTEKIILAYLINRCYNSGKIGGEDLTQEEIAYALNCCVTTINTSIKKLEKLGYISIIKVFYVNARKRNIYRINWKTIEGKKGR